MARFHLRPREEKKKERPAVSDDFIYDEPEEDSSSAIASDTPEEALKKLRGDSEKAVDAEKDPEESEKAAESMQAFRKKAFGLAPKREWGVSHTGLNPKTSSLVTHRTATYTI